MTNGLLFILFIISWRLIFACENHFDDSVPRKPSSLRDRSFARVDCCVVGRIRVDLTVQPVLLNACHSKHIGFVEANARLVAEREVHTGPEALREERKPAAVVGALGDEVSGLQRFHRLLPHLLGGQRELRTALADRPIDAVRVLQEQQLQVPPPAQVVRVDERSVRPGHRLDHDPFLDRRHVAEGDLKLNVEQTSDAEKNADREADAEKNDHHEPKRQIDHAGHVGVVEVPDLK